jgi:hypothetical protein
MYVNSPNPTMGQFVGTQNGYVEFSVRNTSTGVSASGDIAVYADDGTPTSYYVDMGINNSSASAFAYDGAVLGKAHDAYVYNTGGNFIVGNANNETISQSLYLFANPGGISDVTITGSNVGIGRNFLLPKYTLDVSGSVNVNNNLIVSGSITTTGTITAQTLVVQTITSSVEYITGSSINGSLNSNTHLFTGSVSISGSSTFALNVNSGSLFVSASGQVGIGTASPAYILDINGAGRYVGTLTLATTQYVGNIQFGTTSTGTLGYDAGAGQMSFGINAGAVASSPYYRFLADGTLVATITKGGNFGLGTTPNSGWASGYSVLQVGPAAYQMAYSNTNIIGVNEYFDGTNFRAIQTGGAVKIEMYDNVFEFKRASSVTAGSIQSYNTTLQLSSGGLVLMGGASSTGAYDCSLGNATANTYYQVRSTNTNSLYGADTRGTWMGNLSSKEAYINASSFVPGVDNSTSCGSSSYRWTAVYAVNGSIQTSDQRLKTNIQTSDLGLNFINQLNPVSYKWIVGSNDAEYSSTEDENGRLTPLVTSTPTAGVRTHYGLIAQQVKEVLGNKDFGGFVHDKETDMMSLRYDQFISPLIKAIQELKTQNDALQSRIETLESK